MCEWLHLYEPKYIHQHIWVELWKKSIVINSGTIFSRNKKEKQSSAKSKVYKQALIFWCIPSEKVRHCYICACADPAPSSQMLSFFIAYAVDNPGVKAKHCRIFLSLWDVVGVCLKKVLGQEAKSADYSDLIPQRWRSVTVLKPFLIKITHLHFDVPMQLKNKCSKMLRCIPKWGKQPQQSPKQDQLFHFATLAEEVQEKKLLPLIGFWKKTFTLNVTQH